MINGQLLIAIIVFLPGESEDDPHVDSQHHVLVHETTHRRPALCNFRQRDLLELDRRRLGFRLILYR